LSAERAEVFEYGDFIWIELRAVVVNSVDGECPQNCTLKEWNR